MSKRTKYDFERLDKYCKENNVVLLDDYSNSEMTKNSQIKSSYSKKEYIFPSGKKENIQGYEHFALDELIINEKIDESDIIIGVKKCSCNLVL